MSLRKSLATLALGGLVFVASPQATSAAVILNFQQNGLNPTITATDNGANSTTITATNAAITVGAAAGVPGSNLAAFFNLTATNISPATTNGSDITQDFAGSFTITSGVNGTGTNYLSGTFSDATFGSGTSLTLQAGSNAPEFVTFTSGPGGIPSNLLGLPRALSLSFASVTPSVAIIGTTLRGFTSSVTGTFSADPLRVPEPASLFLLGSGLVALAARARRQKA